MSSITVLWVPVAIADQYFVFTNLQITQTEPLDVAAYLDLMSESMTTMGNTVEAKVSLSLLSLSFDFGSHPCLSLKKPAFSSRFYVFKILIIHKASRNNHVMIIA